MATKEENLKAIHDEALNEFDNIQSAVRDERIQCLSDRRFYSIAGAQWEGDLEKQFENKPKFEVNKIHLSVIRIINEYRNNRITVDFVSKEGDEYDKLADVCDGLYRSDEQDSGAQEAYDNAFEEGVGGGMGAWRLRAEYEDDEDEENEKQRIKIEPIFDADSSVFFDLNAKRQDKADAKKCFVLTSMTPGAYKEEYGDDPTSWGKTITQTEFDWNTPDVVFVAEYYKVEYETETYRIFKDLNGDEEKYSEKDFEADEELEARLFAIGSQEVRTRKIKRKRVHKYIISGSKVVEDCGLIAGKHIPIIPIYGKRWYVDNVERCMGHVRLAKDTQRLKNMQLSKLGEISALSSVQKPIFASEQIVDHKAMWEDDNISNYPYLLAEPLTNPDGSIAVMGPQAYTQPPVIPPALAALLQLTETDMKEILGGQGGEEIVSNISGKAVEMIQTRLDMQSYIYMDNFAKGMRRSGEVWLGMANAIFVEEGRKLTSVVPQGEQSPIELMTPVLNEEGARELENDLSEADFDIVADVGPSSTSKKAATVRNLMGMMQATADPETVQVLSATAMMNMEGDGISETKDFFRQKLLRLGAVKPTDEEQKQLLEESHNRPEDPNTKYLNAAAAEADAKAKKAHADTINTIAKAEKTQAETAEIMASMGQAERKELMDMLNQMNENDIARSENRQEVVTEVIPAIQGGEV